jgi:hypothetical protein
MNLLRLNYWDFPNICNTKNVERTCYSANIDALHNKQKEMDSVTHNLDLWWVNPWFLGAQQRAVTCTFARREGAAEGTTLLSAATPASLASLFAKFSTKYKILISFSFCISPVHFCIAQHVCSRRKKGERETKIPCSRSRLERVGELFREIKFAQGHARYTCALLFPEIKLR